MDLKAGNAEDTSGQLAGPVTFRYSQGSAVSSLAADGVGETCTLRIVIEEVALERALPSLRTTDPIRAETALSSPTPPTRTGGPPSMGSLMLTSTAPPGCPGCFRL